MTTKSSPSAAMTSSVETTFWCRTRAARRASSMNIATNSGSFAYCGCSRLMATVRANPAGPTRVPRCTVAMPPDAISAPSVYRPLSPRPDGRTSTRVGAGTALEYFVGSAGATHLPGGGLPARAAHARLAGEARGAAASAVLGVRRQVHATAAAVRGPRGARARSAVAHEIARADLLAKAAVELVALQIDAPIAALGQPRPARARACSGAAYLSGGAAVAAPSTVGRARLHVDADVGALGESLRALARAAEARPERRTRVS